MIINHEVIESWPSRVKKVRRKMHDLAKQANVDPSTLSKMINGHTDPYFSNVCDVEAVLTKWELEASNLQAS